MRTLEEVQATLEIAKLKEEDLQKTIHCLSFGENVSSADYCLMELDDTLCKQIEAGQRYCRHYFKCLVCGFTKKKKPTNTKWLLFGHKSINFTSFLFITLCISSKK